jgi:hypothetical protein
MPQLVKLHEEYKDQGFTVIATHVQNPPREEVVAYLRSAKVNFTVTSFGSIKVPNQLEGIPAAYLFDSKGKLVEAGRPAEMKQTIVELIKSEPHFLVEGRTFKEMNKHVDALKHTKAYGKMLKDLEKEVDKEGRAGKEAKFLVKQIRDYGKEKYAAARKLESTDALRSFETYSEVAAMWKGVDIGDKATERLKELKKDDGFQAELKASQLAAQILEECGKLVSYGSKPPALTSGPNKKIAAKIRGYAIVLFKKYPDSEASKRIREELKTYGFET